MSFQLFLLALLIFFLNEGKAYLMVNVSQEKMKELASFLPLEFDGWRVEGEDELYEGDEIFSYIDGAGEVYKAYNFQKLLVRRYVTEDLPEIVVDFFDMGSSKDAFGVFTHDLDGEDVGIGQGSTYKGGLLSFWKDRFFISVYAEKEETLLRKALISLGRKISSLIPEEGAKPDLLELLPEEELDLKNTRYFHNHFILNYHFFLADENILLLSQETEAVLGTYGAKGDRSYLLVVRYPDSRKASQAYKSFLSAYMPDAKEPGVIQTENKKWTASQCEDNLLVIVFDAPSASAAREFLYRVKKRQKYEKIS